MLDRYFHRLIPGVSGARYFVPCAAILLLLLSASGALAASAPKFHSQKHGTETSEFPFFLESKGLHIQMEDGGTLDCKSTIGKGYQRAKEGERLTYLENCESAGVKCPSKELKTNGLKTLIAYTYPSRLTAEGREVGQVLSPQGGEVFAELKCGAALKSIVLKGSVIEVASPLNTFVTTFNFRLKRSGYAQERTEYETEGGAHVATGLTCAINGAPAMKCALEETSPVMGLFPTSAEEARIEA